MTSLQRAWQDHEIQGGDWPRPEDIGKPLAAAVAGHHRHAILILDVSGMVRFAATRGLFGRPDEELLDRPMQELVPTVPLRANTPGYNIAYVRLAFADRRWYRHQGAAAGCGTFPVEMSIRALSIGRSYALLAAVREVRAADRAAWRSPLRLNDGLGPWHSRPGREFFPPR